MNLEASYPALSICSTLLLFFLGLYTNRKFKKQDEIEGRVRSLELQQASNYGSRDAVDAAVSRTMAPLNESIRRQETKVDELSSLVLKLLHVQGVHR